MAAPADNGAVVGRSHQTFVWLTVVDCLVEWLYAVIMLDLMDIGKLEWLIGRQRDTNKQTFDR